MLDSAHFSELLSPRYVKPKSYPKEEKSVLFCRVRPLSEPRARVAPDARRKERCSDVSYASPRYTNRISFCYTLPGLSGDCLSHKHRPMLDYGGITYLSERRGKKTQQQSPYFGLISYATGQRRNTTASPHGVFSKSRFAQKIRLLCVIKRSAMLSDELTVK